MFRLKLTATDNEISYYSVRDGKKLKAVNLEWVAPDGKKSEVSKEAREQLFEPSLEKCTSELDKKFGKYKMTVPCFDRVCYLKMKKDGTVTPKVELTEKSGKKYLVTLTLLVAHITIAPPSMSKLDIYGTCKINGAQKTIHEELFVTPEMMKDVDFSALVL